MTCKWTLRKKKLTQRRNTTLLLFFLNMENLQLPKSEYVVRLCSQRRLTTAFNFRLGLVSPAAGLHIYKWANIWSSGVNLFGLLTVCSPRCGFSFSIEMTAYYHPCGHWFFNDPIWLLVFQKRLLLIKESANYTRCYVLCLSGQLFYLFLLSCKNKSPRGSYKPSLGPVVNTFCKYFYVLQIFSFTNNLKLR